MSYGSELVTIIYWTVSWLAGIWLAFWWRMPGIMWLAAGTLGILGAILLRRKPTAQLLSICLAIFCLGAIRYDTAVRPKADNHISHFNSTEQSVVTGIVVWEPDRRDSSSSLVVEAQEIVIEEGAPIAVIGKILVRVPRYPEIAYGTKVQMVGTLKAPFNRSGFNYSRYLAQRDIYSEMLQPDKLVLETGMGNPIIGSLLAIKGRAQETINRLFPEPEAALLNGILLGYDRGLPKELVEDFQTTGTTHIIAISGFNIAIIAGILLRGSRYIVAPRAAGIIAIGGISLYTILVGAETAVVRAAIMGALFIVSLLFLGRPTFLYASLFAAVLFMTLVNPLLLWDVGMQLSFMAVLGLMLYVGPWSKRIGEKLEPRMGEDKGRRVTKMIADVFLATMAAILMTLPVMLLHFDRFSLISPLANLLILPAQPGVMVVGGLATILGMISPLLGQIPAWAAWLLLAYTTNLVRFFASLPYSSISLSIPAGAVLLYGGLVVAVTWFAGREKEQKLDILGRSTQSRIMRAGLVIALLAAILVGIWAWRQPDGKLHVTFFDVGQGDAIFVETPKGRQIVIDGGRYPSLFLDKLGREMAFWDKDIDIVAATHADEDHFMGLVELLDHYEVGLMLVNGDESDLPAGYEELLAKAKEKQVPVRQAVAGEVLDFGDGAWLEILHPGPDLKSEERNENSVSVRVVYGDFGVLLTGDAEEGAEREMMESGRPLTSTVFKAGHHGSRSSSSRAFLQAVRPQIVVISAGKENNYDHPHPEVLQRAEEIGATVLRTDEMGSVEIVSDGHKVWGRK